MNRAVWKQASCSYTTKRAYNAAALAVRRIEDDDTAAGRLKSAFDEPVRPARTRTRSTGIFKQPVLQSADSFLPLARSTTQRAELIVRRICRPAPDAVTLDAAGAERDFLQLVKQLDRLSDLLCGVIDMLEVVRNVHPDARWEQRANEAYEALCEYMNVLNVHQGLYEVRWSIS